MPPKNTGDFEVNAATGNPYNCEVHGKGMTGTLNILTTYTETDAGSVRVPWATPTTTT